MSADFTPEKEDLKVLTPFKMQVLTNFPYIEADFDALTNYQLLCKIVEYLNEVIAETNEVTEQTVSLYNAYVALQNYVNSEIETFETTVNNTVDGLESYMNNYFDNLDVQTEINNKLDAMALDGTLTNLIKNYVDPIYQAYESSINGEVSSFESGVNNAIDRIESKVDSVTSGSPAGVYSTVSDLTTADPDHDKIYLVTADGKWYYYDTSLTTWVAGGTYQAASFTLDPNFDSTSLPASAKDTGEYLNKLIKPINLFNTQDEDIVFEKYLNLNSTPLGELTTSNIAFTTGYMPVSEGETLYFPFWYNNYGNNPYIIGYDSNNDPQKLTCTLDANYIATLVVPSGISSIRISYNIQNFNTFMVIKAFNGNTYPESYIPYGKNLNVTIKQADTNFIEVKHNNLFNPEDDDIIEGKRIAAGQLETVSNGGVSGYIPVEYGKTYIMPAVWKGYYGSASQGYSVSAYSGTKEYLAQIVGDVDTYNSDSLIKITISNARHKYIRVNFINAYKTFDNRTGREIRYKFMVLEGNSYPTGYYEYGGDNYIKGYNSTNEIDNPLLRKSLIGLGDSICASYEDDNYKGWIGRIADHNNMFYINTAVGGGTICNYAVDRHCIATTFMRYMSNPDYILFEGGTNDADLIGDATGSVKPEKFGSFTMTNWGTDSEESYYGFDVTTFCGAFEYLIKRLLNNYPNSKIGYIIPMKMGVSSNYTPEVNNRAYYFNTAKQICEKWGVPYLDLWNKSPMNPKLPIFYTQDDPDSYYQDGQHPNIKGYNYINNAIEEFTRRL